MSARPRLFKEIKETARAKEETGIELIPDDMNIFVWRALLKVYRLEYLALCGSQ